MQEKFPAFLKDKLSTELARRSLAGSITFAALAIAITLTNLISGPNTGVYKIVGFTIAAINVVRFFLARSYLKKTTSQKREIIGLHISILLNPILWSILFFQVYDPTGFDSYNSNIAFLISAGVAIGSTYSLAPFLFEAFFFQAGTLIPLINFAVKSWQHDPENVSVALPAISIIFLLYTVIQTLQNRRIIVESASFEFSLIESNNNLTQSQKRLQEQSVKLMHASRLASLGEMAGGIAHEINNPLTIIMGSLGFIQKNAGIASEAERIVERASRISGAALRIKNIVSGLFSFAEQSESLPFEKANARIVIEETLNFCVEKFKSSGIEMQSDLTSDLYFRGRANQVSQILLNILNNSYDAVREVDNKWIKVSLYKLGETVSIEITDSGMGISPDMQTRLFQPFATTKEVGKGTGLGLSIARGIARENGGDVSYIERAAHTTFRITLPLVAEPSKAQDSQCMVS